MAKVEIDEGSGFCFGVVTAINKAEEELSKSGTLYCLGDIVHNSREVERLKAMGLTPSIHESSTAHSQSFIAGTRRTTRNLYNRQTQQY